MTLTVGGRLEKVHDGLVASQGRAIQRCLALVIGRILVSPQQADNQSANVQMSIVCRRVERGPAADGLRIFVLNSGQKQAANLQAIFFLSNLSSSSNFVKPAFLERI